MFQRKKVNACLSSNFQIVSTCKGAFRIFNRLSHIDVNKCYTNSIFPPVFRDKNCECFGQKPALFWVVLHYLGIRSRYRFNRKP